MNKLRNIKNAVFEIAQILGQDDILCRLLVVDDNDPFNAERPNKDVNDLISEKYISMYTPTENAIEDFGRNTFVSIIIDNISLTSADANSRAIISIYVSTDLSHTIIKNNKNRLLEMCDRIETLLDNAKLSSAGQITVSSIQHVMLSELHDAYRLGCSISDQIIRKAEI